MRGNEDRSQDRLRQKASPRVGVAELAGAAATFAAAVAAYLGATGYFFSQDDFTFLGRAMGLLPHPDLLSPLGARIISTRVYFDLTHSLLGLDAESYHWVSLLLHALNATLVYAVARVWTGSRGAATSAGLIFATLDTAFTAVYWISGVQDLLATFFLLASALAWTANSRGSMRLSLVSAGMLALSLLSKEISILGLPALAMMAWARRDPLMRTAKSLLPHFVVTAAAGALFATQGQKVPEGGAYGVGLTTDVIHNLATYIKWTVDIIHPYKDKFAVIDYAAWKVALPSAAACLALLIVYSGERSRHAWASLCWYALLLAPVLPLLRHTYLYYLYPASAGAAMMAGILVSAAYGAAAGSVRSRSTTGAVLAACLVAAVCLIGARNIDAREDERLAPDFVLPRDHVLRAAVLARNADSTFAEAPLPAGASLVLINPYSPESVSLAPESAASLQQSFDVVRLALREGDVLRVRRPDLGRVRFADRMQVEYEGDHVLLYDAYGRLTYLGTGADVWANLSTVHLLRTNRLDESVRCARRAIELAPEHPRANLNLGIALAMTGQTAEARTRLSIASRTLTSETLRAQAGKWLETLGPAEDSAREQDEGDE